MWELDHNKSWAPENGYFQTLVLGKTLGNPLGYKEFRPVNPKENQSWIFIGRTDAEAEAPILWPPDVKSWLIGKDPDAGKDCGQEEKRTTEDETVGWRRQLNEFEQAPGEGEGLRSLASAVPGFKKNWTGLSDWTTITRQLIQWKLKVLVTQSFSTLCNTMDCSPPDSSAHGISQAIILESAAVSFSRVSSWPRDQSQFCCIVSEFFTL